jgi:hypothetical protein
MAGNRDENEDLREVKAVLQSLSRISSDRLAAGAGDGDQGVISLEGLGRADAQRSRSVQVQPASAEGGGGGKKAAGFILAVLAAGGAAAAGYFWYGPLSMNGPAQTAAQPAPPEWVGTMRVGGAPKTPASAVQPVAVTPEPVAAAAPVASKPPVVAASAPKAPIPVPAVEPAVAVTPAAAPVVAPAVAPVAQNTPIVSARQMMDNGKIIGARALLQPLASTTQDAAWLLARSYDPNYLAAIKSPDAAGNKEKALEWYRRWRDIGAQSGVIIDDTRLKRLIETLN